MGIKWRMYRLEKIRMLGKAQMRDSNATLPGYFAIQFTNTWNIYTCEQSDIEEASIRYDTLGNAAIFEIDAYFNERE